MGTADDWPLVACFGQVSWDAREGGLGVLGTATKLSSIPGNAVVWKTEGVEPNSPSDCGFRVTQASAATGPVVIIASPPQEPPNESPSRVVTHMRNMAQEAAVWKSHDHWWQPLSNQAGVGMGAGWLVS